MWHPTFPTHESLPPSKLNITAEDLRTIKELMEDQSWVVLTAEKGVAMVVMDKQDYIDEALSLLTDSNTYRIINKDPTTRLKNKLTSILRESNKQEYLVTQPTGRCTQLVLSPQSFMACPKIHKVGTPSDPLCQVGVPLHMWWQSN